MHISRVVIKNFRSLENVDVPLSAQPTVVIGENNVGNPTSFTHCEFV